MRKGFRGYPAATIAYYGPTDERASKVVVGIFKAEGAEAEPMQKWFTDSGDARTDAAIMKAMSDFIKVNAVKSVAAVDGIIGCPHEEGLDYPEGDKCPQCPFWTNRDRFSGEILQ
jgi:hypothetical protein